MKKIKVLYISKPYFFDMDLSYLEELNKKCEVLYLIDVPTFVKKSNGFEIADNNKMYGIYNGNEFKELSKYNSKFDLNSLKIIIRNSKKSYSYSNLKLQILIKKYIDYYNPDIIHCNNFLDQNYFYFLSFNKKPITVTIHDPFPHSGEESLKSEILKRINIKLIKNVFILNCNQFEKFIQVYQLNPKKVFQTRLSVYTIYNLEKSIRKNDNTYILFFGRISPYKGIEYLIEAFELLNLENKNVKLIIAGSGKIYFDTSKIISNKNIELINEYINEERMSDLLGSASLVVCPYTDATQSGVIMTAFSYCLPVIASNVGGLSEYIDNGITGILVEPRDINAIKKAIEYILANEKLRSEMQSNIYRKYYFEERSWAVIVENNIEFYKEIIKRN